MKLSRKKRRYLYIIGIFFLLFYILPNTVNFREHRYFSDRSRLEQAEILSGQFRDSIELVPGEYYRRSKLYTYFFGVKNRALWTTPVFFKLFNYDTMRGGLQPLEIGGSQQTISIRLEDTSRRHWVLRSVNKDQENVLPWWLRQSILRPVFRDQVSAMNPYAAKVVASLSGALHLPHTNPGLYWVPYDHKHGKYNERMAGRIAYLEEYIDSSWNERFNAIDVIDTDEMEKQYENGNAAIDTFLYLKTRLFDMLINDWDRHKDQWRWALVMDKGKKIFRPIARDRDMAFYIFDEGLINRSAVRANEKFQSFRKDFGSIKGLMHQSEKLDKKILKGVKKERFLFIAQMIRSALNNDAISAAFREYPPVIYQSCGKQHEAILVSRLSQLPAAAEAFCRLINDD
jgi:hypothetical protein